MMKTFLIIAAIMMCAHGNPAAISNAQSDKIFDELNEIGEKLDEIIVEVQDQSIAHDIIKAPESDEVTKRSACEDIKGEDWCKNLLKKHASKCAQAKYRQFLEGTCYKSCGYCPGGSVVKPAPTQAPRGTGVLSEDCLKAHNEKRAKHVDTPAQHWDAKLARESQKWAEKLARLGRSKHSEGPYGENLYWSSANSVSCYDAVDSWYGEIKDYNFETGRSTGGAVGHFTQVVWKPSIKIGCGIAGKTYVVCRYKVTGNFVSRKWREDPEHAHRRVYRANVEKPKSSGDEQEEAVTARDEQEEAVAARDEQEDAVVARDEQEDAVAARDKQEDAVAARDEQEDAVAARDEYKEEAVAARDEYKEIIAPYDHVHQYIAAAEDEEKYVAAARDEEEDLDTMLESN